MLDKANESRKNSGACGASGAGELDLARARNSVSCATGQQRRWGTVGKNQRGMKKVGVARPPAGTPLQGGGSACFRIADDPLANFLVNAQAPRGK